MSGPKAGVWCDFATNAKGRDLVSLAAYVNSQSRHEAARWLQGNIMLKNRICGSATGAPTRWASRIAGHGAGA